MMHWFITSLLCMYCALLNSALGTVLRKTGEPEMGYVTNAISVIFFLAAFYSIFRLHEMRTNRQRTPAKN